MEKGPDGGPCSRLHLEHPAFLGKPCWSQARHFVSPEKEKEHFYAFMYLATKTTVNLWPVRLSWKPALQASRRVLGLWAWLLCRRFHLYLCRRGLRPLTLCIVHEGRVTSHEFSADLGLCCCTHVRLSPRWKVYSNYSIPEAGCIHWSSVYKEIPEK